MLHLKVVKMNAYKTELRCMSANHTMNMQTQCEQVYQLEYVLSLNHTFDYTYIHFIKLAPLYSKLRNS